MAQDLKSVSIAQPGFLGLNTQESGIGINAGWASEAYNCVISANGGIQSRKGWTPVNTAVISGTPRVEQLFEYKKLDGTTEIHSCANNKIYKGTSVLTSIEPAGITANNWKAQNFNGNIYYFQKGQVPLEYNGTGSMTNIKDGAGFADSSDAVIVTMEPNECLAAYGRLWVADTSTNTMKIWWSDLLNGRVWTGGSSGSLDLRSVLTKGMDEIVALREWNGNLVIFLKKHILIYSGATAPSTMALVENIIGIGCVARDSIQEVGTDLVFLSDTGVRSLGRSIQEKSLPITDFSKNVRDSLVSFLMSSDTTKIRSVYSESNAFYLLTLTDSQYSSNFTYCFDLRKPLDDGSYRCTIFTGIDPYAWLSTRSGSLYLGKSGYIGLYSGYLDNTSTYPMTYISTWLDFSVAQQTINDKIPNYGSFTKIPKRITATVTTNASNTIVFRWYYDYSDSAYSNQVVNNSAVTIAEYNIAEYNIAEYTLGGITATLSTPAQGSGRVLKFGLGATINGSVVAIQRLDILAKIGRLN